MSAKEMIAAGTEQASVMAQYSQEQISILRNHVASPDFKDNELAYGLTVARARNLDPFKKQVYFAKRKKRVGPDSWVDAVTVEPTIDGYRVMAERTGQTDGYDGPFWCGEDGQWRDVWLEKKPPTAAKIVVYRKSRAHSYTAVARYSAYVQTAKDGKPNHIWEKMPDNQLAKCAEALALRRAFPDELGEFYTHEEMGQADNPGRFESLPQEKPQQNVITIDPRREQAKQGEALSPVPSTVEQIPASILLAIKPLHGLEGIAIRDMDDDDLDLVREHALKAKEVWKITAKSKRALDWLDAIAGTAATELAKRRLGVPPQDEPPMPEEQ